MVNQNDYLHLGALAPLPASRSRPAPDAARVPVSALRLLAAAGLRGEDATGGGGAAGEIKWDTWS